MFKVYSQKHIDDLQQEHQNAMEFGTAAAEEWVKGLPLLGKQQMADAARLERWEASLPLGSDIAQVLREYFRPYTFSAIGEAPVGVASAAVSAVATPSVSTTSLPAPPSTQSKFSLSCISLFFCTCCRSISTVFTMVSLSLVSQSRCLSSSLLIARSRSRIAEEVIETCNTY